MKVSSSWVQEWLSRTMLEDSELGRTIMGDDKLAGALERAGMELEQIISSKAIDKRVIIGLVKKVIQHPGADRLKLVEIETGGGSYGVVCGSPNVRAGLKVAFAQIGTVLPGGEKIQKAKLRGEVSEGMLCSERELGLGEDHDGIIELPSDLPIGSPLSDIYPADAVLDIKTPANRWDVQSMYGLAREVAAMSGKELTPLAPPAVKTKIDGKWISEDIESSRYMIARVKIASGAASPTWMSARLRAVGVRSVSAVVDVTNFAMLDMGQPLHAFDAAKVQLPLSVRFAQDGEQLETLDGVRRQLSTEDLVIADGSGPIALAGLMGGKATEVTGETAEILLEAAVFDGVKVRKSAQRHGLRTEASARFERGIPVELPPLGLARAVELMAQVAGGEFVEAYESKSRTTKPWSIALHLDTMNRLLGFGVSHKEAIEALKKLGIEAEANDAGEKPKKPSSELISVPVVPWWRPDLREPADLVEEVVRVLGYERVPSTIPWWRPTRIDFDRRRAVRRKVRDILWAAGAFEVMTYSFVSANQLESLGISLVNHLKLKNPLSNEQAYLRSNLLASHLATLERNRFYAKSILFYEISKVFIKQGAGEQPAEPLKLGITVAEPDKAYRVLKGLLDELGEALGIEFAISAGEDPVYAPGRTGTVALNGQTVGKLGQVHPRYLRDMKLDGEVAHLELDLDPVLEARRISTYSAPSPYPSITRDITMLVPMTVTWQAVKSATEGWEVAFVSDYFGPELAAGMKGITVRATLTLPDRTPTEVDANELEAAIISRLRHKLKALPRT